MIAPHAAKAEPGADMVCGAKQVDDSAVTAADTASVLEFTMQVLHERGFEKLSRSLGRDIVSYATPIGAGPQGMVDWMGSDGHDAYEMLFQLIGPGDVVVTDGRRRSAEKDIAVFDLCRVAGGKIVDHWRTQKTSARARNWAIPASSEP